MEHVVDVVVLVTDELGLALEQSYGSQVKGGNIAITKMNIAFRGHGIGKDAEADRLNAVLVVGLVWAREPCLA